MRPFPPLKLAWAPGESYLHVYALPAQRSIGLLELVSQARTVAAGTRGALVPVADQWLHATVQMITVPAARIDRPSREALAATLAVQLADVLPIDLTVGPPLCGTGGVVLDTTSAEGADGSGDGPWRALRDRTEEAIRQVIGTQGLTYDPGPPHMSVAYAARHGDSGPVQSRLQLIRPGRARWRVDAVELLDVVQDAHAHTYTWRPLARIPFGGRLQPTSRGRRARGPARPLAARQRLR
jgi:hypothetical protein